MEITIASIFGIAVLSFSYGVIVGHYEVFPHSLLGKSKSFVELAIVPSTQPVATIPDIKKINNKPTISIHFIDVGKKKSDCILINVEGGKTTLIDVGRKSHGPGICEYVKNREIEEIDLLLLTHYHGDHYGGLQSVIDTFDVGKIILPKYWTEKEEQRRESVLGIINELPAEVAEIGKSYEMGGGACLEVIGPQQKYSSGLYPGNENSTICRLNHDSLTALFMGDAGEIAEQDILESNNEIKSDILKIGHHAYPGTTSIKFIESVKPSEAVITTDGKYSKHINAVVERLNFVSDANSYMTDEHGTVVVQAFDDSSYNLITAKDSQ